jgi:hypothetical protein
MGFSFTSSPIITNSGKILVASLDYYVYLFDANGVLLWKFLSGNSIMTSPSITSSGNIVFACRDRKLYYLTDSPTAAPTAIPTLFPTAAPFLPPKLITVNDGQVLGVSAVIAFLLASVIYLIRSSLTPSSKTNFLSVFFGGGDHAEPKNDHDKLIKFRPLEILIPITLSLTAAGSNILQIYNFMTSGNASVKTLGGIMILARLLVACYGTVLLTLTLSRESFYKHLASIYLYNPFVWILIGFATLFDVSHLRFFPWRHSDFAERSRGFPTLSLFKWALLSSAANSLVQFSLSFAKGLTISSIVSFSLSLGSFLLAVSTAFLKLMAESIHAHDEGGDDQMRKTIAVLRAENERIRRHLEAEIETLRTQLELKEIKSGITKNPLNSRLSISMIYPNNDDIPEQNRLSRGKLEANGEPRPNS